MTWKYALAAGLYFAFFMLCSLAILWWHRRQRKIRLPFGESFRLLRGPGETQLKRSQKAEDDSMVWIIVAGGMPVVIAAAMLPWREKFSPLGQSIWLGLTVITFVATFYFAVRWFTQKTRMMANQYLGYFGERIVAEHLEPLKQEGWRIFHDVPGQNNGSDFNLDHVAVGPGGVYVIETKTRRKERARPGGEDHKVTFDGQRLVWPSGREDVRALEQAERNALWLAKQIVEDKDDRVHVTPVLVFPGWFIKWEPSRNPRLCKVTIPKLLTDLLARDQNLLTRQQIDAIAAKLDARCRDVEY